MACRTENHAQIGAGLLAQLVPFVKAEEPRVSAAAAAAIWVLAEFEETRERLPVAELVPALIAISSKTAQAAAAVASKGETKAAARARAEREERATQATGRTLDELQQWPIGALYALVAGPTAQRVLHRESGELAVGLEPPKARRRRRLALCASRSARSPA